MHLGQHRPWFCALLIDEAAADIPVQAEGLTRPAASVESCHLVGDERLIQRVLRQQVAKLTDQIGMPAKFQLALDALQDRRPAFLAKAVAHACHPVASDPCQRLAAPEGVRLTQQGDSTIAVAAGGHRVCLPAQAPELVQVDRVRVEVEFITAGAPGQPEDRRGPGRGGFRARHGGW